MSAPQELIALARFMGDLQNDICILAEGNVSCSAEDDTLWIKASGCSMQTADANSFVQCKSMPVRAALESELGSESQVRELLNSTRCDISVSQIPSTETFMHAALLQLPGVKFVAHGHPTPLLSLLSTLDAREWATRRLFPDEIVCCGPAACWVPYSAPGALLARGINESVAKFREKYSCVPKTLWLQNHGLIALAETAAEARSICAMSVKAARVLLGALSSGAEIRWMTASEIRQIHAWPDEHYRQRLLKGLQADR